MSDDDLRDELTILKRKLEDIETARQEDTRLALDAAWGIVPGVVALNTGITGVILVSLLPQIPIWAKVAIIVTAAFIAPMFLQRRIERNRRGDIDKLQKVDLES